MALISCPECKAEISDKAAACPKCGYPLNPNAIAQWPRFWGYEWRSRGEIRGWPLVHIAIGFKQENGQLRLRVAKGIIAIGQFGLGVVTIAQFGLGVFTLAQFGLGLITIAQFGVGVLFGAGQFIVGIISRGQVAVGFNAKGFLPICPRQ